MFILFDPITSALAHQPLKKPKLGKYFLHKEIYTFKYILNAISNVISLISKI